MTTIPQIWTMRKLFEVENLLMVLENKKESFAVRAAAADALTDLDVKKAAPLIKKLYDEVMTYPKEDFEHEDLGYMIMDLSECYEKLTGKSIVD